MMYGNMPLYPPMGREHESCVRVPVFANGRGGPAQPPDIANWRRVLIENPCRPGECAEVLLGVDGCGNLVVCVCRDRHVSDRWVPERCCPDRHCPEPEPCRPPRPCLPPPCPPPRPRCSGRLYGSWAR